eukprot:COSAG03_NODE_1481_length_4009_cov_104.500000_1_plen_306_part_00
MSQGEVGVQSFETIRNAGFPYYYYGVHAGSGGGVLVSGFVDGAEDAVSQGITVASFDNGLTWQPPEVIDESKWLGGPIRCTNDTHCVVPGVSSNKMYVTNHGVASIATDWTSVVPDPSVGWFMGPFVAEGESVVVTGIGLCESADGGLHYNCRKSVDPTFDGGIALQPLQPSSSAVPRYGQGLVGGGDISAPVSGWVHETPDGPEGNWTKRDLNVPYPIRWVGFYGSVALAVGGDYFTGVGGIHSSEDGKTWKLDVDTGVEMTACSGSARDYGEAAVGGGSVVVTCVGSARGKPSVIVSTLLLIG